MESTLQTDLIILAVGFVSGAINTIGAGGSFITLPVLILLGVAPQTANASNRVGIVFQSLVSAYTYYRKGMLNVSKSLYLAIPAVLGSFLGAYWALVISDSLLKKLIGVFMITTGILMLLKPARWIAEFNPPTYKTLGRWEAVAFLGIGMYGGFIQAGVGALLLTGMVLISGMDLKRANATKMALSFLFNISSLGIFLFGQLINWRIGLLLAGSSMVGAWIGTHLSLKGGAKLTRRALMVTLFFLAGQLLDFW